MTTLAIADAPPAAAGHSFTFRQWVAMAVVVCTGFSSQMVMPLWVGAVIDDLHLDPAAAGRIASMEFLAVTIVSLLVAVALRRAPIVPIVVAGVSLLVAGNLASSLAHSEGMLTVTRMLCGVGKGLVVAVTFGLAASSARPTRAFAILNISYAVFSSIFYLSVPLAITHAGASGAFIAMAAAAVFGAVLLPFFPSQRATAQTAADIPPLSSLPRWGYAAFLALIILWSGHNAMWTFIDRIGHASGLDIQRIGAVLSLSAIVTIAGPSAVGIVDTRFGYRMPMLAAIALKTIAVLTLATVLTPLVYSALVPLFLFLSLFITPYVLGLLSEADPAGRLAAAASAAMTAGSSSGAYLGGLALSYAGIQGLGWIAALQFALFTILIFVAAAARKVA